MNKTRRIEVVFPVGVDFPEGFEQMLDCLISMACKQYEKEHPDRVMWPAGQGCKPLWDEPNEPKFDDTIYYIEVAEREDLHGTNRHNPKRDELREKALQRRVKQKKPQAD